MIREKANSILNPSVCAGSGGGVTVIANTVQVSSNREGTQKNWNKACSEAENNNEENLCV